MKRFAILFFFFPLLGFSGNIEATHSHSLSEDGARYNIVSGFTNMEDVKFAKMTIEVSEGVELFGIEEWEVPTEKTNNGYVLYIYQTPGNDGVILNYSVSKESIGEVNFTIKYSNNVERYTQSLNALSFSGESPEVILSEQEATIIESRAERYAKSHSLENDEVFTIQVLAVSKYTKSSLKSFCKKNQLNYKNLIKREQGSITKFSIGTYNSWSDALVGLENLKASSTKSDLFINKIKK